jgi:hypothetical protein
MKPFNEHRPQQANFKQIGDEALHGDVILTKSHAPDGFESMTRILDSCLAYGEATGHAHQIFGAPEHYDLRECPKTKTRHLRVVEPVMLKHQEHSPFILPPGEYRIGIQREYDPFEKLVRRVAD